jgi:indole-3-acetate monooxygenase
VFDALCRLAGERAAAAAAAGRLDDDVVAALRGAGLFKLYLPVSLGGHGLGLVEALDVIDEIAAADPAAGWVVMIGAGPNWFADHMDASLVEEVFGPADSCVAGSGKVGVAEAAIEARGDGFRVRGRWRWCSGAPWATWFTFNAAAGADVFTFAVPAAEATLHPGTWEVRGMRATASWDVELQDVFVPQSRTFLIDGDGAGRTGVSGVPFVAFAQATMAAVSVGATRRSLTLFRELAATKTPSHGGPGGGGVPLWRDPVVADRFARAEAEARAAASYLRRAAGSAAAGAPADLALAAPHIAATAAGVARTLWDLSGMSVLADDDPLGRVLIDLQAAGQNAVVAPARFAEAGAALLAAPPPSAS